MNPIEQYELISRELESVRLQYENAFGSWPQDVATLARCIIEHAFEQGFDINTALEMCSIKNSSIYSRFKYATALTPREYQETLRLGGARRILAFEELGIGLLAFRIGYCDAATFSRAFKNRLGVSPSQYRSELRRAKYASGNESHEQRGLTLAAHGDGDEKGAAKRAA